MNRLVIIGSSTLAVVILILFACQPA